MAKKKDSKERPGARTVPAHWRTPETPAASVDWTNPAAWPLGPCWASRIDHVGSQAVYLSRQRPVGNLIMVSAVINEVRGLVDGLFDSAITPSRLQTMALKVSGDFHRAYAVPPEYAAARIQAGLELSQRRGVEPAADYRSGRHLVAGVSPMVDLTALEAEHNHPSLLDQTGVLALTEEFSDWWFGPEDSMVAQQFLVEVDEKVNALTGRLFGEEPRDVQNSVPELAAETKLAPFAPALSEEAKAAFEPLLDTWGMRIYDAEMTERFRQRLLNMAYLFDQAGQPMMCNLAATAAWGLNPQRGFPAAHHPFLRELLQQSVDRYLMLG